MQHLRNEQYHKDLQFTVEDAEWNFFFIYILTYHFIADVNPLIFLSMIFDQLLSKHLIKTELK